MTTTYTGPTPKERELAKQDFLLARPGEPTGDNWALGFEYGWAIGYRRAKAEDAPLLEAAEAATEGLRHQRTCRRELNLALPCTCVMASLHTAIATATGKE